MAFRRWLIKNHPSKKLLIELGSPSRERYIKFFEKFFNENINWKSYAEKWQIEHIVPVALFKAEEIYLCWSIENLRPFEIYSNKIKGSSLSDSLYEIETRLQYYPNNINLLKLKDKIKEFLTKTSQEEEFYKVLLD